MQIASVGVQCRYVDVDVALDRLLNSDFPNASHAPPIPSPNPPPSGSTQRMHVVGRVVRVTHNTDRIPNAFKSLRANGYFAL